MIGNNDPGAEGTFDMTPKMQTEFFFSLITFTFVYGTLLWHRLRLQDFKEYIDERKMQVLSS